MISQFALRLLCGMSATWCLMPRGDVTCGFFRIQMLVALGFAVAATLFAQSLPAVEAGTAALSLMEIRIAAGLAATMCYLGSIYWTLARRRGGGICAGLVCGLSTTALLGSLPRSVYESVQSALLHIGSELASSWLIGGAFTAMLLGHWYLTAPMMKLRPLEILNRALGGAAILRGVVAVAALLQLSSFSPNDTQVIWLTMRWLCGILAPVAAVVLVRSILRYRNTQSATGVLFAAVILVFIGETTAAVLSRDLHWPM
ncbi:hypothetical protein Pan44_04810 [Caulifigura coniformis]|uniref:Uncharacterized protein n=1 Tax=Caulifigura coniformis TaxID=2527983 RepID=A0A517S8M1_9PLAN|nr:hypothetical protein [Caulifigura coniformis]QDT52469.1 hypothetical protein Pan44_04810 [Caulifigura coniformis]